MTFFSWIAEWSKTGEVDSNHRDIWGWKEADFLILDDINPGKPALANFQSSEMIKDLMLNSEDLSISDHLKKQSVAWLIGDLKEGDSIEKWFLFLKDQGIERASICIIDLTR